MCSFKSNFRWQVIFLFPTGAFFHLSHNLKAKHVNYPSRVDCILPKIVSVGFIKANCPFHSTRYINTKFHFTFVASGNMKPTNHSITFIDGFLYPPIKCRFPLMIKFYSGFSNLKGIILLDFSKRDPIKRFIFQGTFNIPTFCCNLRRLTA